LVDLTADWWVDEMDNLKVELMAENLVVWLVDVSEF
jgi:hypothetical protein